MSTMYSDAEAREPGAPRPRSRPSGRRWPRRCAARRPCPGRGSARRRGGRLSLLEDERGDDPDRLLGVVFAPVGGAGGNEERLSALERRLRLAFDEEGEGALVDEPEKLARVRVLALGGAGRQLHLREHGLVARSAGELLLGEDLALDLALVLRAQAGPGQREHERKREHVQSTHGSSCRRWRNPPRAH